MKKEGTISGIGQLLFSRIRYLITKLYPIKYKDIRIAYSKIHYNTDKEPYDEIYWQFRQGFGLNED